MVFRMWENRNLGSAMAPSYYTLGESKVIIGQTQNGPSVNDKDIDYSEYVFTKYFGSYSFANEAVEFTIDETNGQIIGKTFDKLSEKVVEKTGKKVMGEVVGYVPVVGDIVEFVIDTRSEEKQAEEDVKFIKNQYESSRAADIYGEFDCCVNFVDFDLQENKSHVFYPYVGETTDHKIDKINECFGEVLSTDLTREILLMNPLSVWEFQSALPSGSELKQVYLEIIGGKR